VQVIPVICSHHTKENATICSEITSTSSMHML